MYLKSTICYRKASFSEDLTLQQAVTYHATTSLKQKYNLYLQISNGTAKKRHCSYTTRLNPNYGEL